MQIKPRYIVDAKGRRTAVILSIHDYNRLIEDLHDLAGVAERGDERAISFEEMKRQIICAEEPTRQSEELPL